MRISNLLFLCAISLSAIAAYYSIVGLATIFASAYVAVIIMAGMLEISKLVVASWLYQKWHIVSGPIKLYLTSAVVVLMLITSLGIFGFLSKAHVEQNLNNESVRLRIEQIDSQISRSQEITRRYQSQLDQLDRSINIQLDANRPNQALQARQRQQTERERIRRQLDAEQQTLTDLGQQRLNLQQQINVLESEIGPIRYVAEFFSGDSEGINLEKSVRWIIVVLILVFDPLAVLMLIAANMSYKKESLERINADSGPSFSNPVKDGPVLGEIIHIDGRPFRWWDGSQWQPIDIVVDTQKDHPGVMEIKRVVEGLTESIVLMKSEHAKTTENLTTTVESAMNKWLTTVASNHNDSMQDPVKTNSNEGHESLSNQPEPILEKTVNDTDSNKKPSWL